MKLYYSATSPYARKARILLLELALEDRVELVSANPMEKGQVPGPLSKVPCLLTDTGETLFDSPVICAYLEHLAKGELASATDWRVQRTQALADGLMDAAFNHVMEAKRPADQQSDYWTSRWLEAIYGALDEMTRASKTFEAEFDIGQIATVCALGYLDLRFDMLDWRVGHPALSDWFKTVSDRASVSQTIPPA